MAAKLTASKIVLGTAKFTGKAVVGSSKLACRGTVAATKALIKHRAKIGGTIVGSGKGAADVARGLKGNMGTREEILEQIDVLETQRDHYRKLVDEFKLRMRVGLSDRRVMLDTLVVGGHTLAACLEHPFLEFDIQETYELAYPKLAEKYSFSEQVDRLDPQELSGFASGLKGKLFEKQYVDYLNKTGLEEGYYAELAFSPTNEGWDIAVYNPEGAIDSVLQAKATDSAAYVLKALHENPHIDVVTTSEIHSHLAMQGFSDVIDSGISEDSLTHAIESSFEGADIAMSWMPSIISLSIIAVSASCQKGLSTYQKSKQFGERSMKYYFAFLIGGALAVATQAWWVGVLGAMGTRVFIGIGNQNQSRLSRLKELVWENALVLDSMEKRLKLGQA